MHVNSRLVVLHRRKPDVSDVTPMTANVSTAYLKVASRFLLATLKG
jgi:hypothetical protein